MGVLRTAGMGRPQQHRSVAMILLNRVYCKNMRHACMNRESRAQYRPIAKRCIFTFPARHTMARQHGTRNLSGLYDGSQTSQHKPKREAYRFRSSILSLSFMPKTPANTREISTITQASTMASYSASIHVCFRGFTIGRHR